MVLSYEALIRTADAYTEARTLGTGVELDLFTYIGRKAVTAKTIARKANASQEGMDLLLNALTAMGLLTKRGNRFCNTPVSQKYLDTNSPKSITHFLWLAGQHWENWMGLTQAIRRGRQGRTEEAKDDPLFRKRFSKALHERSLYLIPKLMRHIHLDGARSLLDLGGGAGSYALAMLRKTPGLNATIFDRPAALKVALSEARDAGFSKRVDVIGGDLFKDDYGGPYDLVFFSNVVHIYSPKENLHILKKIKKVLKPGGKLLIVEFFLEKDRAHPPDAASFALVMYLFTESGNCYTWEEVTRWLKQHGFSHTRRVHVTESIGLLEATLGSPERKKA